MIPTLSFLRSSQQFSLCEAPTPLPGVFLVQQVVGGGTFEDHGPVCRNFRFY